MILRRTDQGSRDEEVRDGRSQGVDVSGGLYELLAAARPDLLRAMVKTFAEA